MCVARGKMCNGKRKMRLSLGFLNRATSKRIEMLKNNPNACKSRAVIGPLSFPPSFSPFHCYLHITVGVSLSVGTSYVWQRNKNQKHNFLYQFKALSSNKNVRPACLLLLRVFSLLLLIHFALLFICAQLLHTHTGTHM